MNERALLVTYEEGSDWLTFRVSVVVDGPHGTYTVDDLTFPNYRDFANFADFRITAQANAGDTRGAYAFEYGFRDVRVDLDSAETMLKVLRSVDRKLTKMLATEGSAAGFGAYVNRIGRAIGCKRAYLRHGNEKSLTDWTLGEIVWRIDAITERYQETHTVRGSY